MPRAFWLGGIVCGLVACQSLLDFRSASSTAEAGAPEAGSNAATPGGDGDVEGGERDGAVRDGAGDALDRGQCAAVLCDDFERPQVFGSSWTSLRVEPDAGGGRLAIVSVPSRQTRALESSGPDGVSPATNRLVYGSDIDESFKVEIDLSIERLPVNAIVAPVEVAATCGDTDYVFGVAVENGVAKLRLSRAGFSPFESTESAELPMNQWHHLTLEVTAYGRVSELYVDGVRKVTFSPIIISNSSSLNAKSLEVGYRVVSTPQNVAAGDVRYVIDNVRYGATP